MQQDRKARHSVIINKIAARPSTPKKGFYPYTEESWKRSLDDEEIFKLRQVEKKSNLNEGKLVDGELKFDDNDEDESTEPDPDLVEGAILPIDNEWPFPPELIGKPIEEIDPNIKDKTFVVINTRFRTKYIYRFTATKSFFIFSPWNPFRKLMLLIATNQFFDYIIMLTILTNCVFLALNDDYPISEYVFLCIYTLEMLIRTLSRGLVVNSYTYLRDPYNILDIAIVILSYIMIIIEIHFDQNNVNIASIRAIRVLRALKTITILPSLRTIISALLQSLRMLLEVIILSFFCMSVFALFSLQIYQGTLRNKCVKQINWTQVPIINQSTRNYYYYTWVNNASNWVPNGRNFLTCGNDTGSGNCSKLSNDLVCLKAVGNNPNYGYTNFDNFGWALLSMFQLITLDYWEDQYNLVIRSSGTWNVLFFIIVVFFGSFYLINLMLAVVVMAYEEEVTEENKIEERKKKKEYKLRINAKKLKQQKRTEKNSHKLNDGNANDITAGKSIEEQAEDKDSIHFIDSEEEDELGENEETLSEVEPTKEVPEILKGLDDRNCECCIRPSNSYRLWLKTQNAIYNMVNDAFFEVFISFSILFNTTAMACEHYPSTPEWDSFLKYSNLFFALVFILEAFLKILAMPVLYFKKGWNRFDFVIVIASIIDLSVESIEALSIFRAFRLLRVFKLAQSWKTMKNLLSIIFSSITQMSNLSFVVFIVLYLFAVMGMQFLRNTYTKEVFGNDIPRWNFTDFWHSMILVFRIICGEWIEPMWDCARANGPNCLILFIPALVIGNFVVLNLFLALLLNSFASDSLKGKDSDGDSAFVVVYRRLKKLCSCNKNNKVTEEEELQQEITDLDGKETPKLPDNGVKMCDLELNNTKNINNGDKVSNKDPSGNNKLKAANKVDSDSGHGSETITSANTTQTKFSSLQSTANKQDSRKRLLSVSTQNENSNDKTNKVVTIQPNSKTVKPSIKLSNSNNEIKEETKTDETNMNKKLSIEDDEESNDEKEEESDSDEEKPVVLQNCCCDICYKPYLEGGSCYCCFCMTCDESTSYGESWKNARDKVLHFTEHKAFEGIILILIMFSSITLCFEDIYLDDNPTLKYVLQIFNYVFAAAFTFEMILKIIGLGFKVYFTSFWTLLDFIIVLVSLIDVLLPLIAGDVNQISAIKGIRTLRAFRPLRSISRLEQMRIVVNALIHAIPSILNVLVVCIIFWLIFSIVGVQFFKGRFFKCVNSTTDEKFDPSVISNKSQCLMMNQSWINSNINFDNTTNGFLALFQIATFEGWMEIMADAIDSRAIDQQPKREASMGYYAYFVIFIVVGSFFMLNLFIGVIIDNFNKLKKKYEGNYLDMFLTNSQRKYYNTLKKLSLRKPRKMIRRPKEKFRGFFYDVALSNKFEITIVGLIFLNMLAMMIEHYKQPAAVTQVLEMLNIMFTTVFSLEAIVKLIGLGWHYFRYMWNIFDFLIVLLSIIGIAFDEALKSAFITPTLLRVIRIFRIGRVLRLIKVAKGIRQLLFALIISLPALFNIGTLLVLIVFIYGIIGMTVFGNIKHNGFLNDLVNFENFERTMLLLFRLTTAGGWNDILDPMVIMPPKCNITHMVRYNGEIKEVNNGDCGFPHFAPIYMTTFIFLNYLIIINMYIAVILENFNQAHDQEEVGVTEDDFEMFYQVWERYDPHASQYIKYDYISDFVAELDEPLGIAKPNVIALVSFDLPIVEGDKIHCLDILLALVKHVIDDVEDSEAFREIKKQMEAKYEEVFPTRVHTNIISTTMKRKKEDIAAKTLQRAWRRHKSSWALKFVGMSENTSLSGSFDSRSFPRLKSNISDSSNKSSVKSPVKLSKPMANNRPNNKEQFLKVPNA